MGRARNLTATVLLCLASLLARGAAASPETGRSDLARAFEANRGQAGRFIHHGAGFDVRVDDDGVTVAPWDAHPLHITFDSFPGRGVFEALDPLFAQAHRPDRSVSGIPLVLAVGYRDRRLGTEALVRTIEGGIDLELDGPIELRIDGAEDASWKIEVEGGTRQRMGRGSLVLGAPRKLRITRDVEVVPAGRVRLAVDAAGSRYVAGRTRELDGSASAFVAKLADDDVSLVWSTRFAIDAHATVGSVVVEADGGVVVSGATEERGWLATLSSDGADLHVTEGPIAVGAEARFDPRWGDRATIDAEVATPDGRVVIAGRTSERLLAGATIVGPTESGESAFVATVARPDPPPVAAGCPGTINFDNSAGTGAWATPGNWDLDRVPGAGDDVCIGAGFNVTLSSGSYTIQSLTTSATATLVVSVGSLTIDAASTIGGTLTFTSGTIGGAGDVTIAGLFTWNAGLLSGGGTTHANGGIAIGTGSVKDLNPRILDSPGTATWTGTGSIRLGGGASIANGGTWIAQADAQLSALTGGGTFTNNGTLRKAAGAGTTTVAVALVSAGAIEIQSGTLSLNGNATISGTVTGSAGTTLRVNGSATTVDFAPASSVAVPSVIFDAGTANINGSYAATTGTTISGAVTSFTSDCTLTSIGSALSITTGTVSFASGETVTPTTLSMAGGTLTGSDTVTVSGLTSWSAGAMTGGAITNANGGIAISASAVKDLNPRVLKSPGTTTWTGTGSIRLGGGAAIENSGTWLAQGDAQLLALAGGGTFTNTGTLRKTTGTGVTTIAVTFDSSGGIEPQSGTLSFTGTVTVSGQVTGSGTSTLRYAGGTTATFTATSSIDVPNVAFTGGTVEVNGTYAVTSSTAIGGAIANFNPMSTVTSIGPSLSITNGTVTFASGEVIAPTTMSLTGGTLAGSDTVAVSGNLAWSSGTMTGVGVTKADGGMSLSTSSVKDLIGRELRNAGTAGWTGSGAVRFGSGAKIQNDGAWDAQSDASLIALSGGGLFVNAGTLRKSGGTGSTIVAVELESPGLIDIQSAILDLSGGAVVSGPVTGAPGTTLRLSANLLQSSFTSSSSINAGAVELNGGPVTVSGAYAATSTAVGGSTATFAPSSTVTSVGALSVSLGSAIFGSGEAIAPTTLSISGGAILTGSDTITVSGMTTWTAGVMSGTGVINTNGGLTINQASVHDVDQCVLHTGGTTTLTGTGDVRLSGGATLQNSGTWDFQADCDVVSLPGSGTFANSGTFQKSGGIAVTSIAVPFTNTGEVRGLTQTLSFDAGYTQTAGATTQNGGVVSGSSPLSIQGGTLRGTGTVGVSVTSSGGTTSPGLSPGTLGIAGSWTQGASGSFAVELGGLTPGTQHDRLNVTGNASLDGSLDVVFVNGFVPALGDAFNVLTYATRSGTFAATSLPALAPGRLWEVNYKPTFVELRVVPLPSGRIPGDFAAESPLRATKSGAQVALLWSPGCFGTDSDSEVYEGTVGNFTSHVPIVCSTGGATTWTFTPGAGNRYYLVVPTNGFGEGSYGRNHTGAERPVSASSCRVQSIAPCP